PAGCELGARDGDEPRKGTAREGRPESVSAGIGVSSYFPGARRIGSGPVGIRPGRCPPIRPRPPAPCDPPVPTRPRAVPGRSAGRLRYDDGRIGPAGDAARGGTT